LLTANRCILRAYNAATYDRGRGPHLWKGLLTGGLQRFPDPLAGLRGSLRGVQGRRQEGMGGEGKRAGEGQQGRGRRGDVDSDAKLLPTRLNR